MTAGGSCRFSDGTVGKSKVFRCAEANFGMFDMFGKTGVPQNRAYRPQNVEQQRDIFWPGDSVRRIAKSKFYDVTYLLISCTKNYVRAPKFLPNVV